MCFLKNIVDESLKVKLIGVPPSKSEKLKNVDRGEFGVCFMRIENNETFFEGNLKGGITIQDLHSLFLYMSNVEKYGSDELHNNIGKEPCKTYSNFSLNDEGIPHNIFVPTGQVANAALYLNNAELSTAYGDIRKEWAKLTCSKNVGFENSFYLSQREHFVVERCSALSLKDSILQQMDIEDVLQFLLMNNNIAMTIEEITKFGLLLSNGGICADTKNTYFKSSTIQNCLSLMISCGMKERSGRFQFDTGFPCISTSSGITLMVIPGIGALSIYSPILDKYGISILGMHICKEVSKYIRTNHLDDDKKHFSSMDMEMLLFTFVYNNDINGLNRVLSNNINVNTVDYDARTPLHISATKGYYECTELLLKCGGNAYAQDLYNNTPINDAITNGHSEIAELLENYNTETKVTKFMIDQHVKDAIMKEHFLDPNDEIAFEKVCSFNIAVQNMSMLDSVIRDIYQDTISNTDGELADYIPQLAQVNPDQFGVSVCTVDSQRLNYGDYDVPFCIQSCMKPISYCIARESHSAESIQKHVSIEPSGMNFNDLSLNDDNIPHNPLINAGAIMISSLIGMNDDPSQRFTKVISKWQKLCGYEYDSGYSNETFVSESKHADRNFCLGYLMKEKKAFPGHINKSSDKLNDVLEFYFQMCSIEATCKSLSVAAATLANRGVCPTTNERVFDENIVNETLAIMSSSGMYDYSGEFQFSFGIPAKSGVAGALLVVIPGVMGICTWSPRLDKIGNSCRGIEFCRRLCQKYSVHCNNILRDNDLTKRNFGELYDGWSKDICGMKLIQAVKENDKNAVILYLSNETVNYCDYDNRTALHIAASDKNIPIINLLLEAGGNMDIKDVWGNSPRDI